MFVSADRLFELRGTGEDRLDDDAQLAARALRIRKVGAGDRVESVQPALCASERRGTEGDRKADVADLLGDGQGAANAHYSRRCGQAGADRAIGTANCEA